MAGIYNGNGKTTAAVCRKRTTVLLMCLLFGMSCFLSGCSKAKQQEGTSADDHRIKVVTTIFPSMICQADCRRQGRPEDASEARGGEPFL